MGELHKTHQKHALEAEVPVGHASLVAVGDTSCDLSEEPPGFILRQRPPASNLVCKLPLRGILHDDPHGGVLVLVVLHKDLPEPDHVGVHQLPVVHNL